MPRRMYSGSAQKTVLASSLDASSNSITVDDASGYPSGASGNFWIVIDRGLSSEEKILCNDTTGNTLTAVDRTVPANRDDTINQSHTPGAEVEHCYTADDADDANRHIFETTDDDHTQYFNSTRHDAHPHPTSTLEDDSVTGDKIEPSQRWESGDLKWSARATPTSGWLLCDGSAVSRTTFADLFTAIGTAYGTGDGSTTFNVPDYRDRVALGVSGSKARGASGGSANAVAVSHNHTQNGHGHGNTGNQGQDHAHSGASSTQNVDHSHNLDSNFATTNNSTHTHPGEGGTPGRHAARPDPITGADFDEVTSSNSVNHYHSFVTGIQSANHLHGTSSATATNQSAGVSGTGANLPPYQAANCFIKT